MEFVDSFGDSGFVGTNNCWDGMGKRFTELFQVWQVIGRGTARRAPTRIGCQPNDAVDVVGHNDEFFREHFNVGTDLGSAEPFFAGNCAEVV